MGNATLIGFLEEEPGVKSMARLAVAGLTIAALFLAAAAAYVAVRSRPDAAAIIGALAAPLSALAAGIFAALKMRTPATAPDPEAPHA